ncbi:MAG: DUF6440 family protein [Oscillospiraceae bacterium]|nr:DUF6440 family protein [Oscillospiraceae bacterium]
MVYIGGNTETTIFTDTETGIQYLLTKNGYGCGLTVLLDKDGKPMIKR